MDLDFSQFNPSQALQAILKYDQKTILTRTAQSLAPYLHLEALAQSCGLHLRFVHDFYIQAFLVSISNLDYDPLYCQKKWIIEAQLTAMTPSGARYVVQTQADHAVIIMGYNHLAEPDSYFQQRFQCLSTLFSNT